MKKIFSPAILIISSILIIYTYYKSQIVWDGKKNDYYLIYYIISLTLLFFSIITFFLNQKLKEYFIISSITTLISLYIFEVYLEIKKNNYLITGLTLKEQTIKEKLYEKNTGKKYDNRNIEEVYADIKKTNEDIKIMLNPSFHINKKNEIYPLSNISNSKTIFCNELGYFAIYNSDRYGFNNPDEEWDQKEIEFLLIGDSLVHGSCVNRPNDIGSVLRNLSKKSVLNLGQSGTGPLIQYAILREYLNPNVKKILWFYFERNDLRNLANELHNEVLIKYYNDLSFTQDLKRNQKEIDRIVIKSIDELFEKKRNIKTNKGSFLGLNLKEVIKLSNIRFSLYRYLPSKYRPQFLPLINLEKILFSAKELATNNNSEIYFIYLPQYERYKYNIEKRLQENYLSVKKIVEDLNIPFINIHTELFKKTEKPLSFFPFELHGHYNIKGYRKISEIVYESSKD